jgi:hypothetical protein
MTVHLVRRARDVTALACVEPRDTVVLLGAGVDNSPPPGVRCERAAGPGATLDDAALVALFFLADRVIAW